MESFTFSQPFLRKVNPSFYVESSKKSIGGILLIDGVDGQFYCRGP